LNTHYTYFLILAASFAGPFFLSFDKKVAFYTKWKYVFTAMIIPAIFYITWDSYFTGIDVWQFNPKYIIGLKFLELPIEEWLFFIIIPYCCTFVYECIRCYFPLLRNKKMADIILQLLAVLLLITGIIFYNRIYTACTFIFLAVFIALIYLFQKFFHSFDAVSFLVAFVICLIPFLIVNGFLTALPILTYTDAENLGIRIYTIPFEDAFYGMLLILMNIVFYEKLKAG
jgi:lycopene cyclase domain-containing protein